MGALAQHFDRILAVDFEFQADDGEVPVPSALCAYEVLTGEEYQYRGSELRRMRKAPFDVGERTLFVCHYAPAELGCFEALGWPMPLRIIDTWIEERVRRFGIANHYGFSLLHCLEAYGHPVREEQEKKRFQTMGMEGGPKCEEDWQPYLDYCLDDCKDCAKLFDSMSQFIDLPRALIRGRYMAAVAKMENVGVPIDVATLEHMRENWWEIQDKIIGAVNDKYKCYVDGSFSMKAFENWLVDNEISWPRLESGQLDLEDGTFRQMAVSEPRVAELREARYALGQTRLFGNLTVGRDGRNRTSLRPFASRTGRNQPSNAKFIFGTARAIRSLIKPPPGRSIAYLDFTSQEFLVAAALSKDKAMVEAYESGDVYLAFAKQAGAVPQDATKDSHPEERARFKACVLATQYGMQEQSLAARIGCPVAEARELLRLHRLSYPTYYKWQEGAVCEAAWHGRLQTMFGWTLHIPRADKFTGHSKLNPRSVGNFPCQAHGAEILRLACCMLTEAEIRVCCPVHDAVLIEAQTCDIRDVVDKAKGIMAEASRIVLGVPCGVDEKIVNYPDVYEDEGGADFWARLKSLAGLV